VGYGDWYFLDMGMEHYTPGIALLISRKREVNGRIDHSLSRHTDMMFD
jgi:hypothetical protein